MDYEDLELETEHMVNMSRGLHEATDIIIDIRLVRMFVVSFVMFPRLPICIRPTGLEEAVYKAYKLADHAIPRFVAGTATSKAWSATGAKICHLIRAVTTDVEKAINLYKAKQDQLKQTFAAPETSKTPEKLLELAARTPDPDERRVYTKQMCQKIHGMVSVTIDQDMEPMKMFLNRYKHLGSMLAAGEKRDDLG